MVIYKENGFTFKEVAQILFWVSSLIWIQKIKSNCFPFQIRENQFNRGSPVLESYRKYRNKLWSIFNLYVYAQTHTHTLYYIYTLHSFLYHTHTFLYFLKHKHKNAFFKKHKIEFNFFFSSEIIMIHNHHQNKKKTTKPTIYHQHCVTTI